MDNLSFFSPKKYKNTLLKALRLNRLIRQNRRNFKIYSYKHKDHIINSNFKNLNFELITTFYTVVLLGSIKLAAENLNMSQPAITLSLQKIERELGCLLFKSSNYNKSLKLTQQGVIIFNYFNRSFQIIEDNFKLLNLSIYDEKQKTTNYLEKNSLDYKLNSYNYKLSKNITTVNLLKTLQTFSFYKDLNTKHSFSIHVNSQILDRNFKVKKLLRILKKKQKYNHTKDYCSGVSPSKSAEIYTNKGIETALKLQIPDFFYLNL